MGWVTKIAASAQVDYRLSHSAGCGVGHEHDGASTPEVGADADLAANHAVEYRLDSSLPLRWIGSGLDAVGLTAGAAFAPGDEAKARMLMAGLDPGTGEILVKPKLVTDPRGTLHAGTLLAAIEARAAAEATDVASLLDGHKWAVARHGRAERGVVREGDAHRIPYTDARRLAGAAGVDLRDVYDAERLEEAGRYANAKLRVGLMGTDTVFDLPKSVSEAYALAPADLAQEILELHLTAVTEAIGAYEGWASYTMRGEHGGGKSAERLESGGFLGWTMGHQIARPVGDNAPDPHVHIHVTLAHMVRTVDDGKWRTPGAGGRDMMRHAHAVDALAKALFRQTFTERYGVVWKQTAPGVWEIDGVPSELCTAMSKRHDQIEAEKVRLGLTEATRGQDKTISASTREAKAGGGVGGELRAEWRRQAEAVTVNGTPLDVDAMIAAAIPGWPAAGLFAAHTPAPPMPVADLAAVVFDPEFGVTAHRKAFRRADLLARIAEELPGVASVAVVEDYADQLLADGRFAVQMPELGSTHMSNHARYTTPDILDAEQTIIDAAHDRLNEGAAVVPVLAVDGAIGIFEATRGYALSEEQRATVVRFLRAGHGVDALVGVAGSGKTTLLSAAYDGWTAVDHIVRGCSTAATAAANLQAGSGIPSTTLASWLARIRTGPGLAGVDVLVVDEAGMTDDRQIATVMRAAAESGTKVILVGDGKQLRSPGVGGSFDPVHRVVDGLALTENRRQADEAERLALAVWRDGDRKAALSAWAGAGRVHAVGDAAEAFAAMLARWDTQRASYDDPHAQIEGLLMLAATNADVNTLNIGARAIRIAAGEIGAGHTFALAGGGELQVSVGDLILTRVNDYRSAKSKGKDDDVLNGYRGVVTSVDERGISVRLAPGTDPVSLSANYISRGGVQLGYAMTAAKSQGLTSQQALVYGAGLDDHTLYPAMSRDRQRVDLFLPRDLLEDDATRIRLGEPATDAEALDRALAAMVKHLEASAHDIMASLELGRELPLPATEEQTTPAAVAEPSAAVASTALPAQRAAEPEPLPHPLPWQRQHGQLTDAELAKAYAAAQKTIGTGQAKAASARTQADAIDAGLGPASVALAERRAELARQAAAIERARLAGKAYREASRSFDALQAEWRDAHRRKREATGKLSDRKARRAAEADIVRLDALIEQAGPVKVAAQDEYFRAQALLPHGGAEANERITAEHRRHVENAAAMAQAAAQDDAQRAEQLRQEAAKADATVAAAERSAAGLRAEAQTRASMPAGYRALEDGVRPIAEPSRFVVRALTEALREADRLPDGYRAATDRPYGRHSLDGLAESREQLEAAGVQAAATLAANQAASDARRRAVEQGQGPATAGLRAEHERLRAEAARDEACDPIRERLADAESRAAAAQQAQDEIAPELAKPAWQLRAQLKNPATLKARAEEFGRLADAAEADAETAREQLRAVYGGHEPPDEGAGREALKRFERNLPVRAEGARETDLADVLRRDSLTAHSTMQARKTITAASTGLEQIEQEAALREQLPPSAVDLEGYVRTEAGRRAAAEAAERSSRRAQAAAARTAGRGRSPSPGHGYPGHSPSHSITRDPGGPHLGR